jgi:GT2 family glycosyltransferase
LKSGDLALALDSTQQAVSLQPTNPAFASQLESLFSLRDRKEWAQLSGDRDAASLRGPHIGQLGEGEGDTSVVVVTFNSVGTLPNCISSVLAQLGPRDEIVVVDNDSVDGTTAYVERIARRDSRIRLVVNSENAGYSKACNRGLLASKGKYLLTLNPDTVLAPGALKRLIRPLTKNCAATGPLSDNVGAAQFVGNYVPKALSPEMLAAELSREYEGQTRPAKLLIGFCLALRRDVLDEVGLLCEETELGADDLELSWRLRELGHSLAIAPDAFVHHEGGASFAKSESRELANIRIQRSDRALVAKLAHYYGWSGIPSSRKLWDSPIFDEALAKFGLP